ncbi:MAG: 3-oxoacyl-[acyl-carrier protein] reductase [Saprospiraceae bacterium]|jgi:3-oxoacyl-[acyl-carrier protein] reductase
MTKENRITDKVCLITGGTKGIGLGIAHALLAKGAKVIITGRSKENTQKVVDQLLKKYPDKVIGAGADVRIYEDQQRAIKEAVVKWGKVDVAIANAGVGHFESIEDLSINQWKDVIDINLTGAFHTVKAAVEELKKSEGYFISIASLAGTNFFAKGSAYNASKFGLVGFTQAVMLDLRKYGVKVSTVMPGSVATYFNDHIPSEQDAWKIQPEDIGQIVVDLLQMHPRTLPSKVEVRPSIPGGK